MPSQKAQKIDLNADYPCPCGRRGRITPITLTEAFGCNKCQQIFVVEENGQVIEQLSTNYPYKKAWCWTGHQWAKAHSGLREHYLSVALFMILVLPVVWLSLVFLFSPSGFDIILWVMVPLLVVLLLALMQWLAYRRSR